MQVAETATQAELEPGEPTLSFQTKKALLENLSRLSKIEVKN